MKAHHGATACMAIPILLASVTIALASENLDALKARYPLSRFNLSGPSLLVQRVVENSPAARLGLRAG